MKRPVNGTLYRVKLTAVKTSRLSSNDSWFCCESGRSRAEKAAVKLAGHATF